MSDYYNLLNDTLRSGYLQVEKIYNRFQTMDEDKFVNVRTGYPMNYREDRLDFVFARYNTKFPICYNLQEVGIIDPAVAERLLDKYQDLLEDYEKNRDNARIKRLIEEEIKLAKSEPNTLNQRQFNKILDCLDDFSDQNEEEEEEEDEENDSFIMNDDEVIVENKKVKYFSKSLGRKSQDEINEVTNDLSDDQLDANNFLGEKKLRKNRREINYSITDELNDLLDENQPAEAGNVRRKQKRNYKLNEESDESCSKGKILRKKGKRIIKIKDDLDESDESDESDEYKDKGKKSLNKRGKRDNNIIRDDYESDESDLKDYKNLRKRGRKNIDIIDFDESDESDFKRNKKSLRSKGKTTDNVENDFKGKKNLKKRGKRNNNLKDESEESDYEEITPKDKVDSNKITLRKRGRKPNNLKEESTSIGKNNLRRRGKAKTKYEESD